MELYIILIAICIIIIAIVIIKLNKTQQLDNCFYDSDLFSEFNKIKQHSNEIIKEYNAMNGKWVPWPEKYLYEHKRDNWRVFPLYAFGFWVDKNCKQMPTLTKYLKSIPNLKVALLSKMSSKSKLEPHKGWSNYSNYVIRGHYGLKVPKGNKCFMAVKHDNEDDYQKQYHKYKQWIVFDDSKMHYADNQSDEERVVLIMDLARPDFIKKGSSGVEYSKELENMINEFKKSIED
jgi:aspartyl/asparaginyl beta-hydroxylase (cupin superfamily)